MDDSLIGFRTSGEWTAEDLATLPNAASRIYDAFLANEICRPFDRELQSTARRSLARYAEELDPLVHGPLWHELLHEWLRPAQKGPALCSTDMRMTAPSRGSVAWASF